MLSPDCRTLAEVCFLLDKQCEHMTQLCLPDVARGGSLKSNTLVRIIYDLRSQVKRVESVPKLSCLCAVYPASNLPDRAFVDCSECLSECRIFVDTFMHTVPIHAHLCHSVIIFYDVRSVVLWKLIQILSARDRLAKGIYELCSARDSHLARISCVRSSCL